MSAELSLIERLVIEWIRDNSQSFSHMKKLVGIKEGTLRKIIGQLEQMKVITFNNEQISLISRNIISQNKKQNLLELSRRICKTQDSEELELWPEWYLMNELELKLFKLHLKNMKEFLTGIKKANGSDNQTKFPILYMQAYSSRQRLFKEYLSEVTN